MLAASVFHLAPCTYCITSTRAVITIPNMHITAYNRYVRSNVLFLASIYFMVTLLSITILSGGITASFNPMLPVAFATSDSLHKYISFACVIWYWVLSSFIWLFNASSSLSFDWAKRSEERRVGKE